MRNSNNIKPRVIVLTDISSLTGGILEPDDAQSMVRFLLYTNEFDVDRPMEKSGKTLYHMTAPILPAMPCCP